MHSQYICFPLWLTYTHSLPLSLSLLHIQTLRLHLLFMKRRAHHCEGLICFNSCHSMTHCRVLTSILCRHHCLLIPPRTLHSSVLANNPLFLPLCITSLSATCIRQTRVQTLQPSLTSSGVTSWKITSRQRCWSFAWALKLMCLDSVTDFYVPTCTLIAPWHMVFKIRSSDLFCISLWH